MQTRPSMFDPQYRGMESKELLRALDRDTLAFDTLQELKKLNEERDRTARYVPDENIFKPENLVRYYDTDIDDYEDVYDDLLYLKQDYEYYNQLKRKLENKIGAYHGDMYVGLTFFAYIGAIFNIAGHYVSTPMGFILATLTPLILKIFYTFTDIKNTNKLKRVNLKLQKIKKNIKKLKASSKKAKESSK